MTLFCFFLFKERNKAWFGLGMGGSEGPRKKQKKENSFTLL